MRCIGVTALGVLLCLSAPAKADVVVKISKSQQRLAVVVDGAELYRWPVSTGRRGHETPDGTFHPKRLERQWYSRQYDLTPMPWSVFFHRGYAVHGTLEARNLGRAVSHGCVRLLPDNASILFSLVREQGFENTRLVVMDGPLPRWPVAPRAAPVADTASPPAREAPPEQVVKAHRGAEEFSAVKAERGDEEHPAVKTDLGAEEPPVAKVDRGAEERPAAKAQPAAPAPQEAKPAEPPQQEVRLPAPAPQEARQVEPGHQDAQPHAPVPQEAKLAEPTQQDMRLPEPAPHRLAEPAHRDVKTQHHARADRRYIVSRGDDAQVLRGREAWLRGLAHKYGFNKW